MAHGGKREGAGRKPGSRNKITADIKLVAQSFGEEAIKHLVEMHETAMRLLLPGSRQ